VYNPLYRSVVTTDLRGSTFLAVP